MSTSRDEQALWRRVESAVQKAPGPDPARLAAIRAGLDTRRGAGRRHLWLAAALAVALGSTAAAALWLQSEREPVPATDAREIKNGARSDDEIPDGAGEPAIELAPAQHEDKGEEPTDPVIFRE